MFNKPATNPTPPRASPYLDARREWNERYGDYIAQARLWRWIALLSLLIASVSVTGVIYFASQNKLIPYVVELNSDAEAIHIAKAEQMLPVEKRVIRALLTQFVQDLRMVTADIAVQRRAIERLYAQLPQSSIAYRAINEWMRNNIPFERAKTETVAIEVKRVQPIAGDTWRVDWIERTRTRKGDALPDKEWTATLRVDTGGDVDENSIMLNPIGLMVNEIDWMQEHKTQGE
jgi:type IV secretion system protein VirB5